MGHHLLNLRHDYRFFMPKEPIQKLTDQEKLLKFKEKFLSLEELEYLKDNPISKDKENKFRAFVNLTLDVALSEVLQKNQ